MGGPGARGRLGALVFGAMAAEAVFAEEIGADDAALTRLLRALAALELVTETAPAQFWLTDAGQLLRSDRPESMHAFVRMFGDPAMLAAWRELATAVRTGDPTFNKVYGTGFFDYLSANPELSEQFNSAMRQGTVVAAKVLPHHYDFAPFHTIADIGGGDGTLLAGVLQAYPGARGILFDTADGLAQADRTLHAAGVDHRCEIRVGDFLEAAPDGADLYLLKSVVQDWDDDHARTILANIRRVIPDDGRLLLIDPVLPEVVDRSMPYTMYLGDLNMLVNTGGRERTC